MKKILLLLLFISILQYTTFAQKEGQARIDSLIKELPKIKDDTLKGRTYKAISKEYFFIDTDKALYFSRLGLQHATKMNWQRGIAVFNGSIGRAYSDKGNYDSCVFYLKRALTIHEEAKDYWNMSAILNNFGAAEQNIKSDYPQATKYYFEALKVAENVPDKYVTATCLDNISTIYLFQKNYSKSLEYGFKALKFRENLAKDEQNSSREIAGSYASIGIIYSEMKDYTNAKNYLQKSIVLNEKLGNKQDLASAYSKLAITFENDYQKKIEMGIKAKKIWDEVNPNHLDAINNLANIGIAYLDLARKDSLKLSKNEKTHLLNQAESYLKNAINLSTKMGEISSKVHFLSNLAALQAFKGDYKNAYSNFRTFHDAQDSLYSQKAKNEIAGLESKREIELRDKEIKLNKLAIDAQEKEKIGLVLGLALLSIIGGLLFWQNQTRKKTNTTLLHLNSELDEANKIKAKFFAILSHDLRSPVANLISFLHLQKEHPELLSPEIKERNQEKITQSAEDLLETMESMLLWSKGQMQNFKPQAKRIDISTLFDYVEKFFPKFKNIDMSFEDEDNLSVFTDEDYLKTIMQNLTNNSIKSLKSNIYGEIHWKATQENNKVILSLIDNGSGISEQQIAVLYEEGSTVGSKTGFGLYLIRDLAKAIACKISVKSSPNLGSEFQLIFMNG